MPIIYALVSHGNVVVAEASSKMGNFKSVARDLLKKVFPPRDDDKTLASRPAKECCPNVDDSNAANMKRMSYACGAHFFHYINVHENMFFLCLSDKEFPRRISFAFLENVRKETQRYCSAVDLNLSSSVIKDEITRILEGSIATYNREDVDALAKVQSQVSEIQEVMISNIEGILDRSERVAVLVEKTENLNESSMVFRRDARDVRRHMWWENKKMWLKILLCVLILLLFFGMYECGMDFAECRGG